MKIAKEVGGGPVTKLGVLKAAGSTAGAADSASRALLEYWVRAPTTPQRVVLRSMIVLSSLDGHAADAIAGRMQVSRTTVRLWTSRFEESGPEALLHDAPGRGRRPLLAADTMRERLSAANLVGANGLPVSIRRAARFLGVSTSAVWRVFSRQRQQA